MKKLSKIFVLLFTFFVITNAVLATNADSDVLTNDDIVNNIKAEFNFESSENVKLDEDIEGSNLVFGNNVTVNNVIKGVNLLFGNNLTYGGVSEYAAIFGNVVRINGEIINDGAIFGNMVVFDKTSSSNRDIIIFGNNVTLSGTFNRTVRVYASSLEVKDATINGNIKITADDIEVDSDSSILSTFEYNDDADFKNNNKDLIIKKWDEEIRKHNNSKTWIDFKEKSLRNLDTRIVYMGILNDEIITESTAIISINDLDMQNKDNLVGNNKAYLTAFRTNKEYENKGYFSKLYKFMEEDLKKRGFTSLTLGVEPSEVRNIMIYFNWGFTNYIKSDYEYYPNNEKILVNYYEKKL